MLDYILAAGIALAGNTHFLVSTVEVVFGFDTYQHSQHGIAAFVYFDTQALGMQITAFGFIMLDEAPVGGAVLQAVHAFKSRFVDVGL